MTESTESTTAQPLDVTALKALEQAASPAPWTANRPSAGEGWTLDTGEDVSHIAAEVQPCDDHPGRDEADADLIAAMRNHLPALLAELAEARAALVELEPLSTGAELQNWKRKAVKQRELIAGLYGQVTALTADLATARREAEQAQAELKRQRELLTWGAEQIPAAQLEATEEARKRELAEAELARVTADRNEVRELAARRESELIYLRRTLDMANATNAAAQRIVTAALADGTATITPTAAPKATNCAACGHPWPSHDASRCAECGCTRESFYVWKPDAAAPDADSGETYRQPCGCLTNDAGAHRGDCPVWETREDGQGRFWVRRAADSGETEVTA